MPSRNSREAPPPVDTWVILSAYTDFDVLPESTATFGIETDSITRAGSVEKLARRLNGDKEVYRYLCELFPEKFPFDDHEWDLYANSRLAKKAMALGDFENAKKYGKDSNLKPLLRFCTQNYLGFLFYKLVKKFLKK